jgi:hypothetical protein
MSNSTHQPITVFVSLGTADEVKLPNSPASVTGTGRFTIVTPIRVFRTKNADGIMILAGTYAVDDHDIWLFKPDGTAYVVGVLKEQYYKKLRKLRHTTLELDMFEWTSPEFSAPCSIDYMDQCPIPAGTSFTHTVNN